MIQSLTLQDTADFLDCASIDLGHSVVHIGNTGTPNNLCRFVLVNDCHGNTTLSM